MTAPRPSFLETMAKPIGRYRAELKMAQDEDKRFADNAVANSGLHDVIKAPILVCARALPLKTESAAIQSAITRLTEAAIAAGTANIAIPTTPPLFSPLENAIAVFINETITNAAALTPPIPATNTINYFLTESGKISQLVEDIINFSKEKAIKLERSKNPDDEKSPIEIFDKKLAEIKLSAAAGDPRRAKRVADEIKGIRDSMGHLEAELNKSVPANPVTERKALAAEINNLEKKIADAKNNLKAEEGQFLYTAPAAQAIEAKRIVLDDKNIHNDKNIKIAVSEAYAIVKAQGGDDRTAAVVAAEVARQLSEMKPSNVQHYTKEALWAIATAAGNAGINIQKATPPIDSSLLDSAIITAVGAAIGNINGIMQPYLTAPHIDDDTHPLVGHNIITKAALNAAITAGTSAARPTTALNLDTHFGGVGTSPVRALLEYFSATPVAAPTAFDSAKGEIDSAFDLGNTGKDMEDRVIKKAQQFQVAKERRLAGDPSVQDQSGLDIIGKGNSPVQEYGIGIYTIHDKKFTVGDDSISFKFVDSYSSQLGLGSTALGAKLGFVNRDEKNLDMAMCALSIHSGTKLEVRNLRDPANFRFILEAARKMEVAKEITLKPEFKHKMKLALPNEVYIQLIRQLSEHNAQAKAKVEEIKAEENSRKPSI